MRKAITTTLYVAGIFLFTCCNNSGVETKASLDSKDAPVKAEEKIAVKSCCFFDKEEVAQFFPPATTDLPLAKDGALSGNLVCSEDGDTESSLSKTYLTSSGRLVLKISDYCINPRRLELDYKRRYQNTLKVYGEDQQVKEITDQAGMYKGFAIFSAKNKASYLVVIVDDRFGITITGVNQDKITDIVSLFESIPAGKLAGFKKS